MSKKDNSRFDALFGAARSPKPAEQQSTPDTPEQAEKDDRLSKGKNPDYQRTTLYLPKQMHRKFKAAAAEDEREMSEIMETLIQQWLESRSKS